MVALLLVLAVPGGDRALGSVVAVLKMFGEVYGAPYGMTAKECHSRSGEVLIRIV